MVSCSRHKTPPMPVASQYQGELRVVSLCDRAILVKAWHGHEEEGCIATATDFAQVDIIADLLVVEREIVVVAERHVVHLVGAEEASQLAVPLQRELSPVRGEELLASVSSGDHVQLLGGAIEIHAQRALVH